MTSHLRALDTCFSPALYEPDLHQDAIVVVIDILRASSAICTAFANGARSIIPVAGVDEAREYKNRGFLVAAERDGFVLDFADFGNSPFNFTIERVKDKTIVYSTTNGTGIINVASSSFRIVIGSFLNIDALFNWLIGQDKSVFIYRYITTNSIEEKIVRLQERKSKLADTFITSNNPLKDIDIQDILKLIG